MKTIYKLTVFILVVTWYFNDPVPEGFSAPWKLRFYQSLWKLEENVLWIADILGLYPLEKSINAWQTGGEVDIPENIVVENDDFDGVQVRIYKPKGSSKVAYPALVYYHGGGWVLLHFSPAFYDRLLFDVSKGLDIMIVSVDYRLAPQFKFPLPFEDCLKATKYFTSNAESFGVDPRRVAIGGDSAGGNLAAAVSLKLRDEMFSPMPKAQLLIYPALQAMDFSLPSYIHNRNGPMFSSTMAAWMWSLYATGSKKYASDILNNRHIPRETKKRIYDIFFKHGDIPFEYHYKPYEKPNMDDGSDIIWQNIKNIFGNPYFAPLMAPNVSNTPPAYVYTAQYDVLRDDGFLYVKKLRDAGVDVTHVHGKKSFHGACVSGHLYDEGRECVQSFVEHLKRHL